MRPDIVVRVQGAPALVADCKYKRLEPDEFKNHDLYQLLAYCTATQVPRGLLLYPLHAAGAEDEIRIRNTEAVIRQTTIDLGKEGSDLVSECDALADAISAWVQPQ